MKIDLNVLKEKWKCINSNRDKDFIYEWIYSYVILQNDNELKRFVNKHGGLDNVIKMTKNVKGDVRELYEHCSVFLIENYIKE